MTCHASPLAPAKLRSSPLSRALGVSLLVHGLLGVIYVSHASLDAVNERPVLQAKLHTLDDNGLAATGAHKAAAHGAALHKAAAHQAPPALAPTTSNRAQVQPGLVQTTSAHILPPSGSSQATTQQAAGSAQAHNQPEQAGEGHTSRAGNMQGQGGATPPDFHAAYLNNPQPAYPLIARRQHLEGTSLLQVKVTEQGKPISIHIKKSSGSTSLDEAAINAVRGWRFVPAKRGTLAVEGEVQVPIKFQLLK